MLKASLLALLTILALGCGDASGPTDTGPPYVPPPPPVDLLIGNWIVSLNSVCDLGLNFAADRTFSMVVVCVDSGAVDLDEHTGTFTDAAGDIIYTSTKSTCADTPKLSHDPYTVTATQLTITESANIYILARNTATGGSGVASLGCFVNGAFTPSPLAPI